VDVANSLRERGKLGERAVHGAGRDRVPDGVQLGRRGRGDDDAPAVGQQCGHGACGRRLVEALQYDERVVAHRRDDGRVLGGTAGGRRGHGNGRGEGLGEPAQPWRCGTVGERLHDLGTGDGRGLIRTGCRQTLDEDGEVRVVLDRLVRLSDIQHVITSTAAGGTAVTLRYRGCRQDVARRPGEQQSSNRRKFTASDR
jgi:hypothetical protein